MRTKTVISLCTGLEDTEKVTVAFLVAVGSAETQRPTLMFLTKEAVRLVVSDVAGGNGVRRMPFSGGSGPPVLRGRGTLHGLPDLLRREAPWQRDTPLQRRTRWHSADVGVDR